MLSRLQELRKEEETLLRIKAALHDQLNRLKVEELALQSMISAREGNVTVSSAPLMEEHQNMDNETAINQTKLQLQMHVRGEEEEEEEEEESDS
ncbi:snRNA-activating protein complex subunit 5 [Eublepharis macularius]|uniref:snRNA-activating protein complex subunit 5 n=1 Tax=Eublepharis macularius TaxID=481883 RepID=A0AA97LKH4_EUBMA|nr:snRNA-activating protein complex subunit 5 [Eublepharis macularius]